LLSSHLRRRRLTGRVTVTWQTPRLLQRRLLHLLRQHHQRQRRLCFLLPWSCLRRPNRSLAVSWLS
jgi:hypothetical protein